ncbi:type II secretion system F family protein [Virgibacillus sp. AGTR]|uniref:Type II secretion system F family protein n=1 Tax=Virgibacillus salarius TaxID=447199 RepID=A0A941IAD3_9BACI|nr:MULTISPECIES: competence type IV pilus assembly protein ComGB [Virgibacillus]MBR7797794.1 type II secretion system F family protein [Virgibacillus salarius]MCC2252119.1 type II secretion system F family protein [Virgibacillus sp. AGTR]NAZ10504.1 chromosome partitioning protein ParA [Agaribacter marinus]QRZ17396.1 type II secretion system F family protein [Virgibacillus sp. AGTR]
MDTFLKHIINKHKKTMTPDTQLRFLKRLHRLRINGYSLIDALTVIAWDNELECAAKQIKQALENGYSMEEAMQLVSFHPSITSYLLFARSNQNLEDNLSKCIDMYEYRLQYIQKFQQIIRYPLILCCIFIPLLFILKQSVLPSFLDLYESSPGSSASIVLAMLILDWLGIIFFLSIIAALTFSIFWKFYKPRISIENQIKLYNRLPLFRTYLKLQTSFLFANQFSSLIKTGISFKDILIQMNNQDKQPIICYYANLMKEQLAKGMQLPTLLSQFTFLEKKLTNIFQKNSNTETLEKDLSIYAQILMEEFQRKMLQIITYIQPIFFIIVASFILFIYITLMLPMFQLIKSI